MRKTRIVAILSILFAACATLGAQEPVVDSTLLGKDIFSVLPQGVEVHQSQAIAGAMANHRNSNASRTMVVYRVRIFNDNKQTARALSEEMEKAFTSAFPDIPAYRTYSSPYFRITVGDFRTRSEAMALMEKLKGTYSNMIVLKENTAFPLFNRPETHSSNMEIKRK